jgi:hypothetical protein
MITSSGLERVGCGKFLEVCYKSSPTIAQVLTSEGNFYSIVNDYDKPARIFFAQGCEVQEEFPESQ